MIQHTKKTSFSPSFHWGTNYYDDPETGEWRRDVCVSHKKEKKHFLVQKNIVTTYLVLVSYALRFSWKMKHYAKLNNSTVVEFEIYKPICFRFCFKAMSFKLANNLFNEYGFVLHIKTRLSDVVCLMTLKLKSTRLLLYVNLKLLKIVYSNNLF